MAEANPSRKLTDDEKLHKAKELKERGNQAFKDGQFHKAKGSYHRAILYIKGLSVNSPSMMTGLASALGQSESQSQQPQMPHDMVEFSKSLGSDCHNNLAACLLKEDSPKYDRIIELCSTALECNPNNKKALFRQGTSLYYVGKYEEALKSLDKAGSDSNVRKYKEMCKVAIKKEDQGLAETYRAMFKS